MIIYRTFKVMIPLLLPALLLFSCERPNGQIETGYSYLSLSASAQSLDYEGDGLWGNSAELGVFMTNNGTYDIVGDYANLKYTASFNSVRFTLVPSAEEMILPQNGSLVDIYAYYPYMKTLNGEGTPHPVMSVDVTDQTNLKPPMLMTAQAKGMNKVMNRGLLSFTPMYARLSINLVFSAADEIPEEIILTLHGLPCQADVGLMSGKYISFGEKSMTSMIRPDSKLLTFEAIVLPHEIAENEYIRISRGSETNETSLKDITGSFEPNRNYKATIEISPESAVAVQVNITDMFVSDWENDFNNITGEIYNNQ